MINGTDGACDEGDVSTGQRGRYGHCAEHGPAGLRVFPSPTADGQLGGANTKAS